MLKKIASLMVMVVLISWINPVLAAKPEFAPEIPEQNGIYDVPGHPGMKLRVFVHHAKPDKPGPGSSSILQCNLTDPTSDAVVSGAGWVMEGNWTYKVNTNVPATISPYIYNITSNSVTTWMNIHDLNSAITLQYGGTTNTNRAVLDGQNIIAWGRASGSALGVTYIWYQNGVAQELDTIMNNKFSWNWSNKAPACAWTNVYDAQDILTHELGHWFGLDDKYDSNYQNNTMYGYGSTWEVKKDTLTAGDIAGINTIY
jgi:hypothetical protein